MSPEELRSKYALKDTRDWSIARAKADVGMKLDESKITPIDYRWGDIKFLYYTGLTNGIVAWPRYRSLSHMLSGRNFALLTVRQTAGTEWNHVSVSRNLVDDCRVSNKTKERGYVFPLYIEPGEAGSIFEDSGDITSNFNQQIVDRVAKLVGKNIVPLELFDYIYGYLHSPLYREKYKEFLRVDFPRVPYPKDFDEYTKISQIGKQLRELHTMANSSNWVVEVGYPIMGNNIVEKVEYKDNRVYINQSQYFGNISESVFNYYIGGYQPAHKWLKDRMGLALTFEDIRHYQKIIYALSQTEFLVKGMSDDNF